MVKELVLGALAIIGLACWTAAQGQPCGVLIQRGLTRGIFIPQGQPLTLRLGWVMLALSIYSFIQGYMYQSITPVIYWKRIWR